MSDEEALYRTIVESPQDDAPRLVYADWLEDQGRETQARFIRLSIDYDRNQFPAQEINKIGQEIWQLWSHHAIEWNWRLPKRDGFIWGSRPKRGFVNKVQFYSFQSLYNNAEAILNSTPIEVLHIDLYRHSYQSIGHLPLGRVAHIHVHCITISGHFFGDFLAIPHRQPWHLFLDPNDVRAQDVATLFTHVADPQLKTIDIDLNGLEHETIIQQLTEQSAAHPGSMTYNPTSDILSFTLNSPL